MADTPSEPTRTPPPSTPPRSPRARPPIQVAPLPAEASSSSVQTIMLGLGALLLGVAAVTFVGVAITGLDARSQLTILLLVAGLFLLVSPAVASRGLAATAETLSAIGLLVFAVAGYPLWSTGAVTGLPAEVYTGLVAAATAGLGHGYHRLTRLRVPNWTALLAAQLVLPLVAAPLVTGAAGWALVFAVVAAVNAGLATAAGPSWLGYAAWTLHGLAVAVAVCSATAGLFLAASLPSAAPAAVSLLLAAGVGAAGGYASPSRTAAHVAAGLCALAVIVAGSRLVWLALPGRALLPVAAVMTATALSVQLLPPAARLGPRRACAWALTGYGVVLAGLAVRAGFGAVVWPPWPADLTGYPAQLATAVGPAGWQLAATAAAATVGAWLALPAAYRREVTVAGAALTALAAPASLGLEPGHGAWVMMLVAAALGMTGLSVDTRRAAITHIVGGGVVGLAAAGTALAAPSLTATILTAITVTAVVVAGVRPQHLPTHLLAEWAAGAATLALPGAAVTATVAAGFGVRFALGAGFAAVCCSLGYAAYVQLRHRFLPVPVRLGTGLATTTVATAAFLVDPHPADVAIGILLLAAAAVVIAGPHIDAMRRGDRLLDGADLAAAAVTVSVVVVLARVVSLTLPLTGADAAFLTAAVLILVVTLGVRALPAGWRRGPVLGVSLLGALVAGTGAAAAVAAGLQTLALVSSPLEADLSDWRPGPMLAGLSWAVPIGLALLAVAAGTVLPRPVRYHTSTVLAGLATVAAPVGLGLPWWAPAGLSTAVGAGYALCAVGPPAALGRGEAGRRWEERLFHPQAAWPRAGAAVALAAYAVGASLARSWLTGTVLGVIAVVGTVVAALAADRRRTDPRLHVGGTAVTGVLFAVPGGLAAFAAHHGYGPEVSLPAALGGVSLAFVILAALHAAFPAQPEPAGRRVGATPTAGTTTPTAGTTAAAAGTTTPTTGTTGPTTGPTAAAAGTTATSVGATTSAEVSTASVDTAPPAGSPPDAGTTAQPAGVPSGQPGLPSSPPGLPSGQPGGTGGGAPATLPARPGHLFGSRRRLEPPLAPYLPFATVGVAGSATVIALVTLTTPQPTGVYAAAAVILAVLAELVRSGEPPRRAGTRPIVAPAGAGPTPGTATTATARTGGPGASAGDARPDTTTRGVGPGTTPPDPAPVGAATGGRSPVLPPRVRTRSLISPPVGALLAAATPATLALISIAPALIAALVDPYQTLAAPWQGPPAALVQTTAVPATSVLAALLLTLAAALAAVGFGGAVTRQAVPLTAPGLAVTMLIAPPALDAPWPTGTVAALLVFTISMLGVALTPPPPPDRTIRPLRVTRMLVLAIGLAAGGAGLAGSLAEPDLTWATLGGAVAVGAGAALGGRTRPARLLGWLFAAASAHAFALVTAYLLGASLAQAGFLLLVVGAVALLVVARLPRLRPPRERRELAAVEWFGGYAALAGALVLGFTSPPDLAAILIGTGAVLGLAAVRAGRSYRQRRVLWWSSAACEVLAWWLLMRLFDIGLVEAYTLPFAAFALAVGALEMRHRPELGSWATFTPGLVAAFGPSLILVITTTSPALGRQVWVILGGVATLLIGSRLRQRAPLIIGTVVTAAAALHLLSLAGPWLMLIPIGLLLLVLGANREKRQRDLENLRGAYSRMR